MFPRCLQRTLCVVNPTVKEIPVDIVQDRKSQSQAILLLFRKRNISDPVQRKNHPISSRQVKEAKTHGVPQVQRGDMLFFKFIIGEVLPVDNARKKET